MEIQYGVAEHKEVFIVNKIIWDFTLSLEDDSILDNFEIDYAYRIPEDLKKLIRENNAGIPEQNIFDSPKEGMVFAGLLSFNKNDEETVYMVLNNFIINGKLEMIPFGTDGFGNIFCLKCNKVVLWNHENEDIKIIADSLSNFLEMLHK
mgnify:CR=1 FL=1